MEKQNFKKGDVVNLVDSGGNLISSDHIVECVQGEGVDPFAYISGRSAPVGFDRLKLQERKVEQKTEKPKKESKSGKKSEK